jgi:predicted transcriptional regulator
MIGFREKMEIAREIREYLNENGAMSEYDIIDDCGVTREDIEFAADEIDGAGLIHSTGRPFGSDGRWYAANKDEEA